MISGKILLQRADEQFFFEHISLIENQDDRSSNKPPRAADGVEQCEGFLHTVDGFVFEQQLVVLGDGDQE